MRELSIDDFVPRRGKPVEVDTTLGPIPLLLAKVQPLPSSGRAAGSFRLELHGPLQPFLPQGTYAFLLGKERCPIFMVPLGPTGPAMRYEALFL
ncbi:MAG TPA: hypothetical protein VN231_01335 [Allosphingosinicella sp.]|nr:hypothetical protein [Allosphingosinicella sp.]